MNKRLLAKVAGSDEARRGSAADAVTAENSNHRRKKTPRKQKSLNSITADLSLDSINLSSSSPSVAVVPSRKFDSPKPLLKKNPNLRSMVFSSVILIALRDHVGSCAEELSFQRGDAIYFLEKDDNEWVRGSLENGNTGWFDKTFVKFVSGRENPLSTPGTPRSTPNRSKDKVYKRLDSLLAARPTKKELKARNVIKNDKKVRKNTDFLTKFFQKKRPEYSVFGKSLQELISDEHPIPILIEQIIEYLREKEAWNVEGIFRMSGGQDETDLLRSEYNSPTAYADFTNSKIHSVAVLLKQFLMELPDAVIPFAMYRKFTDSYGSNIEENVVKLNELVQMLPEVNFAVLRFLMNFLVDIAAYSETNLMGYCNLGVVFGPSLIRPQIPDTFTLMSTTNSKIVELFVEYFNVIFEVPKVEKELKLPPVIETEPKPKSRSSRRVKSSPHSTQKKIKAKSTERKRGSSIKNLRSTVGSPVIISERDKLITEIPELDLSRSLRSTG